VVAHDELVSESILAMVPARTELVSVGRRSGHGHTDYRLHPLVLERAREGKVVVRLKAGDPLVFGRGGEEAQELASAGIPFEIVPGVSAALGAASYAGIPLTHRALSAQVVITSGHRVDGGLPPPGGSAGRSLALYMASHELSKNIEALVVAGWTPGTPAALIIAATTAEERVIVGTLKTLASRVDKARLADTRLPALVVVGDVVSVREQIDWRIRLPLRGRRVIVARARTGPSSAAMALRTLGADVVELPHVERELRTSLPAWSRAVAELDRFGAIVVASDEAVEALASAEVPPSAWPCIVAIGADIASKLRAIAIPVAGVAEGACGIGLEPVVPLLRDRAVLVPVTQQGRASLAAELREARCSPELVVVSEERRTAPARWPSRVHLVVLPASSAANALYAEAPAHIRAAPAVAIGARTEEAARRWGVGPVVRAPADTVEALVDTACGVLSATDAVRVVTAVVRSEVSP
jgi:uroporphyrinogen III methyltransferase/synthase